MAVRMTVQRDGYFDGTYARAGDTIRVEDDSLVATLEVAGFAVRQGEGPPPGRKGKGVIHAR